MSGLTFAIRPTLVLFYPAELVGKWVPASQTQQFPLVFTSGTGQTIATGSREYTGRCRMRDQRAKGQALGHQYVDSRLGAAHSH